MPIQRYSVLKGKPSAITLDDDNDPHVEIRVEAGGVSHRIAVNIRSGVPPYGLLYKVISGWADPRLPALAALPDGRTAISDRPELALDYVRNGFITQDVMDVAPFDPAHPKNDLRKKIVPLVEKAIADGSIEIYAYGSAWVNEAGSDEYFGFTPGNGIHEIHMNQGSGGRHVDANGVYQDGALLLRDTATNQWTAAFFAFQGQSWMTDDKGDIASPIPGHGGATKPRDPDSSSRTTSSLRIIAAMINAPEPEAGKETVTLLNISDLSIDVTGMAIEDDEKRREVLSGQIHSGDALRVTLKGDSARLGNKRGTIRLKNPSGSVIDAVSYGKADVGPDGWTVIFR